MKRGDSPCTRRHREAKRETGVGGQERQEDKRKKTGAETENGWGQEKRWLPPRAQW